MTEETQRKRRLISPIEWFFLIIVIIILLTFGLDRCGLSVLQRTDDTEIIQKPHQ